MTEPEASGPPPSAEPDTLRGELLERCACLIDAALEGSVYAATRLSNLLSDYGPGLVPQLMERCARARRRKD